MNWAVTAAEQIIAVKTEESAEGREDAIKTTRLRENYRVCGRLTCPDAPDVRSSYHPDHRMAGLQ